MPQAVTAVTAVTAGAATRMPPTASSADGGYTRNGARSNGSRRCAPACRGSGWTGGGTPRGSRRWPCQRPDSHRSKPPPLRPPAIKAADEPPSGRHRSRPQRTKPLTARHGLLPSECAVRGTAPGNELTRRARAGRARARRARLEVRAHVMSSSGRSSLKAAMHCSICVTVHEPVMTACAPERGWGGGGQTNGNRRSHVSLRKRQEEDRRLGARAARRRRSRRHRQWRWPRWRRRSAEARRTALHARWLLHASASSVGEMPYSSASATYFSDASIDIGLP